ncbi:MAG TPA: squalene--hopene cyclase [Bacteroidales bacterium]|nr:squalene--hopene cyclase [Bacteroidales bacterium]
MAEFNIDDIKNTVKRLEEYLLSCRNEKGVWDGRLSSSALSTAVASFGLWIYDKESNKKLVFEGLNWLKENLNKDGGFGDTTKSQSNLSTTLLCWSALSIVKDDKDFSDLIQKVESWLLTNLKSLEPKEISKAILNHYKSDKTFSVPILSMCAISGRLGCDGWKYVPQLPFQLAAFPDRFFKWFNLSVVSYAIPALISIGLVRQKNKPARNPLIRLLNQFIIPKVLKVLSEKQPDNGGFLEAAPLTGFVLMSLVKAGKSEIEVCSKAERFLQNSIRTDGSWPIDTSLTTWVTTLAVNSFSNEGFNKIDYSEKEKIKFWLMNQQHRNIHPFTKSDPGGWAWIDSQGGAPDGDDTSGALLALKRLQEKSKSNTKEATLGLNWLMSIQNSDGGIPTFCKGWGKLPFDASCPDITAHALRAFISWKDLVDSSCSVKIENSIKKALIYLKNTQRNDGSWLPLWFGNEEDKDHLNPVYGTSQVLLGLSKIDYMDFPDLDKMIKHGVSFLKNSQNKDGGWGGNKNISSSIEETSLAIRALLANGFTEIQTGANYLMQKFEDKDLTKISATPIGLYFASLWYYEDMYPIVFSLAALNDYLKTNIIESIDKYQSN